MTGEGRQGPGGRWRQWRPKRRELLAGAAGLAVGVGGYAAAGRAREAYSDRQRSREPGELTVISGADQSQGRQRRELIRLWNEQNPRYPARMIELAGVADDHHSEMVARAQADEPSVDIYNLDVTWIAEFAEFDYIRSLDDSAFDADAFLGPPWQTCEYDGELWAVPFNTDAGLLFVWEQYLPGQQEPADLTWQTIAELAAGADRPEDLDGLYAGQYANYEGLTVNALERIWAAQGDVDVGELWDPTDDVDSFDFGGAVCSLMSGQVGEDPLVLPESVEFTEAETTRAFREQKVLFMRNWPVAYRSLEPTVDDGGDAPPAPGVWRLPGRSVLGGQNLAIDRRSPRWRAAQDLIEFLTDRERQRMLFLNGGLAATRRDLYADPDILERYPYAETLREAVEAAVPRPSTPYYVRFSEVFRDGVHGGIAGPGPECVLPGDFANQLEAAVAGRPAVATG